MSTPPGGTDNIILKKISTSDSTREGQVTCEDNEPSISSILAGEAGSVIRLGHREV